MMAVVVSLINMKGGVGKTTLSFNLAHYFAYWENLKVLIVDLDPQANASQYALGAEGYLEYLQNGGRTVLDVFEQFLPPTLAQGGPSKVAAGSLIKVVERWSDGSLIHLIPSRLELAYTMKNPAGKEHLLAKFLAEVTSKYDLVLIDCAPTESVLTTSAYRASRFVLVPVKPEYLATIGLPLLARSVDVYHQTYGDKQIELAGVVFNDADANNVKPEHEKARTDVKALASHQGWYVFENEVRHSDSYPSGARAGKPIYETKYARGYVADEFKLFAKEFKKRVGL